MTSQTPKRQQLTKLITEQFIALWEQERSLWDPTSPLYRSKQAKQQSLQLFKEQLDFEEHEVKTKINTLRSYFIAEMKKMQRNANYELKWTHYDSLMFLKDTINSRKRLKDDEEDGAVEETYDEHYSQDDKTLFSTMDETELSLVTMCSDDELINKENRNMRHSPDEKKRKVVNGTTDAESKSNPPPLTADTMVPTSSNTVPTSITSISTSPPTFNASATQKVNTLTHETTRVQSSSPQFTSNTSTNTPLVVLSRIATHRSNDRRSLQSTKRPISSNARSTSKRPPFSSPKLTHAVSRRQTVSNPRNSQTFLRPISGPIGTTSSIPLPADGDELFGLSIGQSLKSIPDTKTKEYIKYKMQELIYKAHFGLIGQPENKN